MNRTLASQLSRWGAAVTAAIAIAVLSGSLLAPASAATVSTSSAVPAVVKQTNSHRAASNRAALTNTAALNEVAQAWAKKLASSGTLKHNPHYSTQIPRGWTTAGENVAYNCGFADPVNRMMTQWKNSAGHNKNMLNSAFTHIGVGWASDSRGCSWAVQVFAGYPSTAKVAAAPVAKNIAVTGAKMTGATSVGSALKVSTSKVAPSAAKRSIEWRRDGKTIKGATGSSYKVTRADRGKRITAKVTYRATGHETRVVWLNRDVPR